MYSQLKIYLQEKTKLDSESLNTICSYFKIQKTKRNELLCNFGKVCKKLYFINDGGLRQYEIDGKGNEITGSFALENNMITVLPSFINQEPSTSCLAAIEPSELLVIYRDDLFGLVKKYPEFASVYHQLVEESFIQAQKRVYSMLGMEGIEKLKWVMKYKPKFMSRISSKAIASYLGMTNSTLSKLRAQL